MQTRIPPCEVDCYKGQYLNLFGHAVIQAFISGSKVAYSQNLTTTEIIFKTSQISLDASGRHLHVYINCPTYIFIYI